MAVTPPWLPGFGPDSIAAGETVEGFLLSDSVVVGEAPALPDDSMSWVYLGLALLFLVVGLHVKSRPRYWKALVDDLTDTRERHNVFDETVRETTFLVLLNFMWAGSIGVLLWKTYAYMFGAGFAGSAELPDMPAEGIGVCSLAGLAYTGMMTVAYWMVGRVFSDARHTMSWVRGSAASTALQSLLMFPVALLALVHAEWTGILLIIAACVFVMGKIVFIFKGFRIFFNHFSSWLLFLYYLCSLEIVPLILTYVLTLEICLKWL